MNDTFDKIYLINLESCTERLGKMEALFAKLGITDYEIICPLDADSFADTGSQLKTTMQSCKEAHLRIYQDGIDNNYSKIMVFEDDCCFNQDDASISENYDYHLGRCTNFAANNDFDLFYFDNIFVAKKVDMIMQSYVRVQTANEIQKFKGKPFSHAYAISSNLLQSLVDYANDHDYNIDRCMRLIDGDKYFYSRGLLDQELGVETYNNWNSN